MIGAMVRHMKSLRRMTRDHGWIHTLLEEAENERMHLLTALELRRPGPLFKVAVIGTQGKPLNTHTHTHTHMHMQTHLLQCVSLSSSTYNYDHVTHAQYCHAAILTSSPTVVQVYL